MTYRYLHKPYLISGNKFDLRIYVYVTSYDPLRIYIFSDGLVRFASCKWVLTHPHYDKYSCDLYRLYVKVFSLWSKQSNCTALFWTLVILCLSSSGIRLPWRLWVTSSCTWPTTASTRRTLSTKPIVMIKPARDTNGNEQSVCQKTVRVIPIILVFKSLYVPGLLWTSRGFVLWIFFLCFD